MTALDAAQVRDLAHLADRGLPPAYAWTAHAPTGLRYHDWFCGAGGSSLGLTAAGMELQGRRDVLVSRQAEVRGAGPPFVRNCSDLVTGPDADLARRLAEEGDQPAALSGPPTCAVEPEWVDRQVAARLGLSVGQVFVLTALAQGWTHARIARALRMSPGSVRNRALALFARLEVHNAAAAVAKAYDCGLLRTRAARVQAARAAGLRVAS